MDKNSYNTSTHTTEQNSHANQCDPNNSSYHSNRGENNNGTTQKNNNVQINISIPSKWKKEFENLARIYYVEEGKSITFLDLMRRGIQGKYQLGENNERGTVS